MDRAVITKESSAPVKSRGAVSGAPRTGTFGRGLLFAAPLATGLWALIFWLI